MQQLKILNKKEVKQILAKLKEQWGFSKTLNYTFLRSTKDKIYLVTNDLSKIDLSKLRIDKIGLYFCKIVNQKEIRFSIEGSQLIGPYCNKNIIELTESEMKQWLQGFDLDKEVKDVKGFALIKHNNDFLGSGKIIDGKILNYIPKARRIKVSL